MKIPLLIILGLCVSCSPVDTVPTISPTITPLPSVTLAATVDPILELHRPLSDFPGMVNGFDGYYEGSLLYSSKDWICIFLWQKPFWEPGDYWYAVEDLPETEIIVDGELIEELRQFWSTMIRREYDENGNEIGIHSDSMDYCFLPREITAGIHTVTVQVTSTSGKKHIYEWDFRVE